MDDLQSNWPYINIFPGREVIHRENKTSPEVKPSTTISISPTPTQPSQFQHPSTSCPPYTETEKQLHTPSPHCRLSSTSPFHSKSHIPSPSPPPAPRPAPAVPLHQRCHSTAERPTGLNSRQRSGPAESAARGLREAQPECGCLGKKNGEKNRSKESSGD